MLDFFPPHWKNHNSALGEILKEKSSFLLSEVNFYHLILELRSLDAPSHEGFSCTLKSSQVPPTLGPGAGQTLGIWSSSRLQARCSPRSLPSRMHHHGPRGLLVPQPAPPRGFLRHNRRHNRFFQQFSLCRSPILGWSHLLLPQE